MWAVQIKIYPYPVVGAGHCGDNSAGQQELPVPAVDQAGRPSAEPGAEAQSRH